MTEVFQPVQALSKPMVVKVNGKLLPVSHSKEEGHSSLAPMNSMLWPIGGALVGTSVVHEAIRQLFQQFNLGVDDTVAVHGLFEPFFPPKDYVPIKPIDIIPDISQPLPLAEFSTGVFLTSFHENVLDPFFAFFSQFYHQFSIFMDNAAQSRAVLIVVFLTLVCAIANRFVKREGAQ